jgi:hypothetical protein
LGLSIAVGDSSSATVIAGQSASYTLSIGGAGMSGTASFSCTGAPMGANCSVPTSQPFGSTAPTTFTLNVTTTAHTTGVLRPSFAPVTWSWIFAMLAIALLPPGVSAPKRSLRRFLRLAPLTLLLLLSSCGGGSTGSQQPNSNGTPAGTYTLNITATSGITTQTVPLTLIVR